MKFLVVLPLLLAVCLGAEQSITRSGPAYNFNYNTGDLGAHARTESKTAEGKVSGRYSYVDPNGHLREVRYSADKDGFKAEGDVSVDKKTAQEAAAIAALAPKVPLPVAPAAVPVAPVAPAAVPVAPVAVQHYTGPIIPAYNPYFYSAAVHNLGYPLFAHRVIY